MCNMKTTWYVDTV